MYYFSSIYFINQFLHVSGMFIVHRQEIFTVRVYVQKLLTHIHIIMCICVSNFKQFCFEYNTYQFLYVYNEYLLMMGNKHPRNM
jgi:hypothetical protein